MDDAKQYLDAYGEHSKVIRTWFVAYGIGAPVLLLTDKELAPAVRASGEARGIALWFLVAVALQVLLAALNKFAMWGLYYGTVTPRFQDRRAYRIAFWFSERILIDLLVDVATLICFGIATWSVFGVVVG